MFYDFDPYITADTDLSEAEAFKDFDPQAGSGAMLISEPTLDTAEGETLLLGVTAYS